MGVSGKFKSDNGFVPSFAAMVPIGDYKRAGGFVGIRRLISEKGGDPRAFLNRHGINPRAMDDGDSYISYSAMIRVMEDCALELDEPFFGFELAKHQGTDVIGPPAALLLASANVADGLGLAARYFSIHAPGARLDVQTDGSDARLSYEVIDSCSRFSRQVNELSMTVAFAVLRAILGQSFKLDAVEISSDPPPVPHDRLDQFFDAPILYGQPISSLRFASHYLDQKIDSGNATLLRLAQSQCDQIVARANDTNELEHLLAVQIRRLLPVGACTLQVVASQLGLHPRTLQNRLMERGLEFRELVRRERMSLAEAYLSKTRTPLAEVAMLLGYADQTCFTRAFSSWSGNSPRKFRALHQDTKLSHTDWATTARR